MITNDGKEIISKFILGQVPSFATHLSIGCGARPLTTADIYPNTVISKTMMDFEMIRVPISSKGFIDASLTYSINNKSLTSNVATLTTTTVHDIVVGDTVIIYGVDDTFNGQYTVVSTNSPTNTTFSYARNAQNVNPSVISTPYGTAIVSRTKISLTAELPTTNKYEITEVGLWSAANNNLAGLYDSRMIFDFSQNWSAHSDSTGIISTPSLISDKNLSSNSLDLTLSDNIFYVLTNEPIFNSSTRKSRQEGPRHLNKSLLIKGNMSKIIPSGADQTWNTTTLKNNWTIDQNNSSHIHINDINFDISGNNSSDIIKLAFSIIDKMATGQDITDVKILIEFFKNESTIDTNYAKMQIYVPGAGYINYSSGNQNTGKYYIAAAELSQSIDYTNYNTSSNIVSNLANPYISFYTSNNFSPKEIRMCRIYAMINASGTLNPASGSENHYISFDGLRIDSTVENPVYKMCGYSIVKKDGKPISKLENTNNYVDFRFSLGSS